MTWICWAKHLQVQSRRAMSFPTNIRHLCTVLYSTLFVWGTFRINVTMYLIHFYPWSTTDRLVFLSQQFLPKHACPCNVALLPWIQETVFAVLDKGSWSIFCCKQNGENIVLVKGVVGCTQQEHQTPQWFTFLPSCTRVWQCMADLRSVPCLFGTPFMRQVGDEVWHQRCKGDEVRATVVPCPQRLAASCRSP